MGERLQNNADRLAARYQAESDDIQQEVLNARLGTREVIEDHEWDGAACRQRLYNERKNVQLKHRALVKKVESEEQERIDSARFRPMRSPDDPAIAERNQGFRN